MDRNFSDNKSHLHSLTPDAAILLKNVLFTSLYNTWKVFQMIQVKDKVDNFTTFDSYKQAMNKSCSCQDVIGILADRLPINSASAPSRDDNVDNDLIPYVDSSTIIVESLTDTARNETKRSWLNSESGQKMRLGVFLQNPLSTSISQRPPLHYSTAIPNGTNRRCILCGANTTKHCKQCVPRGSDNNPILFPLCSMLREYQRATCFERFHNLKVLPDKNNTPRKLPSVSPIPPRISKSLATSTASKHSAASSAGNTSFSVPRTPIAAGRNIRPSPPSATSTATKAPPPKRMRQFIK